MAMNSHQRPRHSNSFLYNQHDTPPSEHTPFLSGPEQSNIFNAATFQQKIQQWLPSNKSTNNYSNLALFQPSHQEFDSPHGVPADDVLLPGSYDDDDEQHMSLISPQPPPGIISSFTQFLKMLPPKDTVWAILFVLCLGVMIFLTMGLWLTPTIDSPNHSVTNPLSVAIKDTIPILITTFLVSSMLGALWILLIGAYVQPIVWATILFIPAACLAICSWSLYLIFSPQPGANQSGYLIAIVITTFISSCAISLLAFIKRHHIRTSIYVIQLATHIIRMNGYSILGLSFGLLLVIVCYLSLYIATIYQFIQLFDTGTWVSMGLGYYSTLALFSILMFWGVVTITSIYQLTISNIVHYWYFCRQRPKPLTQRELVMRALKRSCTTMLGTACLGGLIQSVIYFVQLGVRYLSNRRPFQVVGGSAQSSLLGMGSTLVRFIMKWIQYMNHYTMAYSAITGHSFLESAKQTSQLLANHSRVNHIMIQDLFIQVIFALGNFILCSIVGLSIITVLRSETALNGDTIKQGQGNAAATSITFVLFVSMWICFAVMRFWGLILSYVIDATYLCYVIDCDNGTNHFDLAHFTFNKEPQIPDESYSEMEL